MHRVILALTLSLFALAAPAQQGNLDPAQTLGLIGQASTIEQAAASGQWQTQGHPTREAALQRASELRRQALQIFLGINDLESASIQLSTLAANSRQMGQLDLALQDLRQAALIDLQLGRPEWFILDLTDMADVFRDRGYTVDQSLALRELARLAEQRGQRREACEALNRLADIHFDLGDFRTSLADSEHAVEMARPLARPELLSRCLHALGRAQREMGRLDSAQASLDEALNVAATNATRGDALNQLARLAEDRGDMDTALRRWREVIALDEQSSDITFLRTSWQSFIEACLEAGQTQEAVATSQRRLDRSRRELSQTNSPTWRTTLALDLISHADVLLEAGNPTGAQASLNEALGIYGQINSLQGQAEVRFLLAETSIALNQPQAALQHLGGINLLNSGVADGTRRWALLSARANAMLGNRQESDRQIAAALQEANASGRLEDSAEVYEAVADIYRRDQNASMLSGPLRQLATIQSELGRVEEAEATYEELLAIYPQTQELREWSQTLTSYAVLCENQGDLTRAMSLVERALEIDQQRQDNAWVAIDNADLARLRAASGDLEGAIAAARQTVTMGEQMNHPGYQVEGLQRVADYQAQAGQMDAAMESLQRAEQIAAAANNIQGRSVSLSQLATLAAQQGDWAAMERWAQQALTIDQQMNNRNYQALDRVHLAVSTGQLGRPQDSLAHSEEALRMIAQPRDPLHVAATINRSQVLLNMNRGDEAVSDLLGLVPLVRDWEDWGLASTILHVVAQHQVSQRQSDLAIDSLAEAIDLAERELVEQPINPALYLPNRTPRDNLYDEIIALLNEADRAVDALEYVSRQDGLELNAQTLMMAAADNPELTAAIAAEEQPREATRSVEPPTTPESTVPPVTPTPVEPGEVPPVTVGEEESVAQGEWANVLSGLSEADQAAFEITPMNIPFILRSLPDDQTLFVMYHLGAQCNAYVGSLDMRMQAVPLAIDRDTVVEQVVEFRRLVRESNDALEEMARNQMSQEDYGVFSRRLESQANDLLATLYRELVQPLEAAVPHYRQYNTVLLYPSGVLRMLPFGALVRTRPDGRQEYWVESRQVVYFPAGASDIAKEHMEEPVRRPREGMLMLAWPGSRQEHNYIENVLTEEQELGDLWSTERGNDQYHALREDAATRDNLLAALVDNDDIHVLHLATHGNLRPGNPQESYISLANRERLRIGDLWSLPLENTRLTVLSMCNAEYNPDGPSDPLGTFARAIYIAGCPSVVASLWRVRDESARALMVEFYRNLLERDMSRGEALSQAQRAMIATRGNASGDYSHPFHWGPFVLIGEWR